MDDSGFVEEAATETTEPRRRRLDVKEEEEEGGRVGEDSSGVVEARASSWHLPDAVVEEVPTSRHGSPRQKGEVFGIGLLQDVWIGSEPLGQEEDVGMDEEEGGDVDRGGCVEAMDEGRGGEMERCSEGETWERSVDKTMEKGRFVKEMEDGESEMELEDFELDLKMEDVILDLEAEETEDMDVGGKGRELVDGGEPYPKFNSPDGWGKKLPGSPLRNELCLDGKEIGEGDVFRGRESRPQTSSISVLQSTSSVSEEGTEGGQTVVGNTAEEDLGVKVESRGVVDHTEDTGTGESHLDDNRSSSHQGGSSPSTKTRRSTSVEDDREGRGTSSLSRGPSMGVRNPKGTRSSCGDMVSLQGADHASCFLQRMKQLRHSEHLTDVLLRCDGGGILAHRLILTSYSEHLREILEGLPPGRRLAVSLPTVPLEAMEALLDYMYFGNAVLPRTHIPELRRVARELKVESLERVLHREDDGEQFRKNMSSTVVEVGGTKVTRSSRGEEMGVEMTDELLVGSTTGNSDSEVTVTAALLLTSVVVDSSSQCSLTTVTERPTSPVEHLTPGKPTLGTSPSTSLGALSIADSTCASSVVDSPDGSCVADISAPFSIADTTCVPFHSNKKSALNGELTSSSTRTESSSILENSPDGDLTDAFSSAGMLSSTSGISSSPDSEWSIPSLTRTLVSPTIDGHAGKYKLSRCTGKILEQRGIHGVLEDDESSKFIAKTLFFDKIVQAELDSCNCSKGIVTQAHTSTQTDDYRQTTVEAELKPEVVNVEDSSLSVTSLDPLHSKSEKRTGNQNCQQTKKLKMDSSLQDIESQIERFTTDKCEDDSEETDLLDVLPRTTEEEIGILLSPEMKMINVASSSTTELGSYAVSEEDVGFYAKNLTDLEIEEEGVSDEAKTENQVEQENFPEVLYVVEVNKREEEKIDVETQELPSSYGSNYRPNEYHHWPTGLITTNALQQPILNYGWNTANQDPWHWFRVGKNQEYFDDNSSHPSRWDELSSKYYDPEMKHLEQRSGLHESQVYRCGLANNYIGALIGRHDPPMHMDFTPYLQGTQVPRHGTGQDAYGEDQPSSGLESQLDTKEVPENDQQDGGSRPSSHGDYAQPQKCEDMLFREALWNCDQNIEESEMYKVGDNDTDSQSIHDLTDVAIHNFKVGETSHFSEFREQSKVGGRGHIQRRRGSSSLRQQKQHRRRLRSSKSEEPRRVSQRSRTMSLRALQWMVDKDLCKTPPKMKKSRKEFSAFDSYDEKDWEIMPTLALPASRARRAAKGKKRQTPQRQFWPRAAKCDASAMSVTPKGIFPLGPNELHEQAEASSSGPSRCQNSTPADDPGLSANSCITPVKSEVDTTKNAGVYVDDYMALESNLAQKSNSPGFTSGSYMSQAQGVHSWEECDKSCATGLPPLLTDFSKMDVVQWSQLHGLLAQEVACPSCKKQMPVQRREELRDGYTFRCHLERTGPKRHDCKRSIRSGSWFARSSLSIRHILQLTYMWALGSSLSNVVRALKITSKSIIDWFCHCRAICEMATVYEGALLGGEGVVVEVRECYLVSAKRKNGHLCNELYLLAGLDMSTGRCFLEKVQDRDSATLRTVLLRWVQFGSVVRSQCWETYDPEGSTASHLASCKRIKREATDWSDAAVSLNSEYLDHFWHFSKRIILKGRRDHHHLLPGYLAEAMWRWEHRSESNIFLAFVRYIAKYFNPNESANGNRPSELRPQSSDVFGVKPHAVS
ncbi:uncharacterized protein LOC143017716 [Oratosquilla oratoria]|uniref:uncharacterized protein LOC143017716 n=1 Tax=Oratosquilla oratoria TaxID=337810 RepID=UPI003F769A89